MKYVYGPVRSRRLGLSLGISTVPYKVCSLDCVYCQLKKTTAKTRERKRYADEKEILEEVRAFFEHHPGQKLDHVTFSGSGEPTLHKSIGNLIRSVKRLTPVPAALITNSTTLVNPQVRRDLLDCDIVVPSLDAVTQDVFEKIDRPLPGIKVKDIIRALAEFRKIFKGEIWLEVMLVSGLNDSPEYLRKIKKVTGRLKPDRIQLNAPVRPPSEDWVKPVSAGTLKRARAIFGDACDII